MQWPSRRNRDTANIAPARRRSKRLIGSALVGLALLISAAFGWRAWQTTAKADVPTVPVVRGDIKVTIESSGTVKPEQSVDLHFQSGGKIKEVLVDANQQVKASQVLARLDDRELRLQVQQAEADLKTAEAQVEATKEGSTTPEQVAEQQAAIRGAEAQLRKARSGNVTAADIAQAEAVVRQAEAQLQKARSGNVTAADLAQAEAVVRQAEAQLQKARSGPEPDTVSNAETALRQAEQNLQKVATNTSAAKTTAQQSMEKAADDVRLAQTAYSSAFWDNQQAAADHPAKREYEEALGQAQLRLSQAEISLEQAKVAYENARQQEIAEVAAAQAQVDNARVKLNETLKGPKVPDVSSAQAQLDQARAQLAKLKQGGTAADIASAQAQLDQARAQLAKLKQGGTAADITSAQAQLDQARAQLAKLKQGGTAADIAVARAQVEQLRAGLDQLQAPVAETDIRKADAGVAQAAAKLEAARLKLDQAILEAPFDGTITALAAVPGSYVSSGAGSSAAFTLVDLSSLHLDVSLSESDVARVKQGQAVEISFDALPDQSFNGKVTAISATAQEQNSVVTYPVRVDFDAKGADVKVGMTASASFVVEEKQAVIQLPSRAIQKRGPETSIQVLYKGALEKVRVETGITNGSVTEIVKCVDTGNQCLRPGDQIATNVAGNADEKGADQPDTLIQIAPNGGPPPQGPPRIRRFP